MQELLIKEILTGNRSKLIYMFHTLDLTHVELKLRRQPLNKLHNMANKLRN